MVSMSIHTAVATIHTTQGDIVVNLFGNHAPKTVRNFIGLATGTQEWTHPGTGVTSIEPLYNGVIFHRIISQFMLQAGDPLGQGTGGPGYEFDDEIHPELQFSTPYLLAMANAGSRGGRGTNGSQFFISTVATPWLNGKHTIFGAVADEASKKVVDAIEAVPTNANDKPLTDVVITSIEVAEVA
jgi:peptidyl-prolyl cis-trans isomerase A (cyclophilin A)